MAGFCVGAAGSCGVRSAAPCQLCKVRCRYGAIKARVPLVLAARGRSLVAGRAPDGPTGWAGVSMGGEITLKPGMALTFSGIAQGFGADAVRALLLAHGYETALIDMGEVVAFGGADPRHADRPRGQPANVVTPREDKARWIAPPGLVVVTFARWVRPR